MPNNESLASGSSVNEALLTLIADITEIMSESFSKSEFITAGDIIYTEHMINEIGRIRLSAAISKALKIAI